MADTTNAPAYSTAAPNPNNFDLGKFLQSVVSSAVTTDPNNPMQNWQGTANSNPSGLHDNQAKALDTVLSALDKQDAKDAVDMHGKDAMRQLLDFHMNSIQPQQAPQTPAGDIRPLVINGSSQGLPGTDVTGQSTMTPLQQQAMKIIQPDIGVHPVKAISDLLGYMTGISNNNADLQGKRLQNIGAAQKTLGEEPIQPKDIATMDRETYGKTVTSLTDTFGKNIDQLKNLKDQYIELNNTRSPIDMAMSRPSDLQRPLLEQMKAIQTQNVDLHHRLTTVLSNAPKSLAKTGNFKVTQIGK